jgi:membrane associated rhomboid family serine protease
MSPSPRRNLGSAVEIAAVAVGGLFVIHLLRFLLKIPAAPFGIVPRHVRGLEGILFAPLLHANWEHLFANALPLFIFLILLLADRHYYPYRTLPLVWIASGAGTWLIGREHSVHIGASGVIFGLAAYLILAGFMMRRWQAALVAAILLVLFGGMFYGVIPQAGPLSWEGHLSGALAGAWAARRNHGGA